MTVLEEMCNWVVISLLVLLFSPTHLNSHQFKLAQANEVCSSGNGTDLLPLIDEKRVKMMMVMNETRRKLNSFQVCAPCTCCGANHCFPSPCCFAINCNIPNKPFGFCAFTPKACNCIGCHL